MRELPIVGAALTLDGFAMLRDDMFGMDRDLELQDFHAPSVLQGDIDALVDRAQAALAGYQGRHGLHGPFWDLPLATWDPDIRKVIHDRMFRALDVCEALGSTHMVVHSPYTEWDHFNIDTYPNARDGIFERFHTTMAPVCKRAADIGTTLVLENIGDIDPPFRVDLADSFKSAAFQISIDTGHAHYVHRRLEAPPLDDFVSTAQEALQHVHLQDNDGLADSHWALGAGTINWHSFFAALGQLNRQPRLIIEVFAVECVRKSIAYLQAQGLAR